MSAFMVNDDTLDLLASATEWAGGSGLWVVVRNNTLPPRSNLEMVAGEGERGGYYARKDAPLIKEELRLENIASLWARYPKDGGDMAGDGAPFRVIYPDQATIGEALGALSCYEYQACESNEWPNSYAFAICQGIRKMLSSKVSGSNWEYTRPAYLAQRVSLTDLIK